MIKEKELLVNITRRNIGFYKEKGYKCELINKEISIKIEDVNKKSRIKITAICEECGEEKHIQLNKYHENVNRGGYYGCKKCSRKKFKKTNLEFWLVNSL
jgi:transcription elongation factor Elf1